MAARSESRLTKDLRKERERNGFTITRVGSKWSRVWVAHARPLLIIGKGE